MLLKRLQQRVQRASVWAQMGSRLFPGGGVTCDMMGARPCRQLQGRRRLPRKLPNCCRRPGSNPMRSRQPRRADKSAQMRRGW